MMGSTKTLVPLAARLWQKSEMMRVSSSVTMKPVEMASNSKPNSSQMARLWRTYSVVS